MKRYKNYAHSLSPTAMLVQGYLVFLIVAWTLLSLPFSQATEVLGIDVFFTAASAVSTTGLISVDPGTNFSLFGQIVILAIIQIGGIGYMTFGSFILLSLKHKAAGDSLEVAKGDFAIPKDFDTKQFVKRVISFTFIIEGIGVIALFIFFHQAGESSPLWFALFHSVSAFCTAGFSLMATNFQDYQSHFGINMVVTSLSILGAVGFIIIVDVWELIRKRGNHLHFTSKIILKVTFGFILVGTVFIVIADPTLADTPLETRWMIALFQVVSATTTAGFNTYDVSLFAPAIIVVMYVFMLFGASPGGTGGGLKSTTFAALIGLVKSTLKKRKAIKLNERALPREKIQHATSSFIFCLFIAFISSVLLLMSEDIPLSSILFEVFSALGTVGLSMGATSELSNIGKIIVVFLMFIGRVGILTFGIVMSSYSEDDEEKQDNDLAL